MARDLLTIPATSAASERAFTVGKDIFGISRMSLKPETVEALICLRSWYKAGLVGVKEVYDFLEENFDTLLFNFGKTKKKKIFKNNFLYLFDNYS
jgi:hypothetical protein